MKNYQTLYCVTYMTKCMKSYGRATGSAEREWGLNMVKMHYVKSTKIQLKSILKLSCIGILIFHISIVSTS